MCRIEWKNKITGFKSHGDWQPMTEYNNLCLLAKQANKDYKDLTHVVVTK